MPKRERTARITQPNWHPIPDKEPFSQYLPLNQDRQEIRVVTLHAGADDIPISCAIDTLPLAQAQPFYALSYCWGSPGDVAEITLNGELINIRKNLLKFLRSLRHLNGTIRIWVDYICINQEDVNERNHQVHMMADIYKSAVTVYAWLGRATKYTNKAIDYINGLPSAPLPGANSTQAHQEHWQLQDDLEDEELSARIPRPEPSPCKLARQALQHLIKQEYWTRVWVVQEVLLARELSVVVGYKTVRWKRLLDIFSANADQHRSMTPKKQVFESILKLTAKRTQDSCLALPDLLSKFSVCQCHDPRDRIYGMLGLLKPEMRSKIQADYRQTVIELCVRNFEYLGNHVQLAQYPNLRLHNEDIVRLIVRICGKSGLPSELRRWEGDPGSPLGQEISLVYDASINCRPHMFETFAAMKTLESDWEPFTTYNQSETFAVYMTRVKVEPGVHDHDASSCIHHIIVYSTVLPSPGDLIIFTFPPPLYRTSSSGLVPCTRNSSGSKHKLLLGVFKLLLVANTFVALLRTTMRPSVGKSSSTGHVFRI